LSQQPRVAKQLVSRDPAPVNDDEGFDIHNFFDSKRNAAPCVHEHAELQRLHAEDDGQLSEVPRRNEYEDEYLSGSINIPLTTLDTEATGQLDRAASDRLVLRRRQKLQRQPRRRLRAHRRPDL
jgi:hypothetical protein